MLLKYFVTYEMPSLIWSRYLEQDQNKLEALKDYYLANWLSHDKQQLKEAQVLQRIIWGVLLDFIHPLGGNKIAMEDWLSLDLHHWKTASGHENKYECRLFSVIPLPKFPHLGEPVHIALTGQIRASTEAGKTWENRIREVISTVFKGEKVPKTWKDDIGRMEFDQYIERESNINARKLILWLFLNSQDDIFEEYGFEKSNLEF